MPQPERTELHFINRGVPRLTKLARENGVLIYDRNVVAASKTAQALMREFPSRYAVSGGEGVKRTESFSAHVGPILRLALRVPDRRQFTLFVLGGGSVGDFGGIIAHLLWRGVRLVHIPTTLLAAVDSAHGGKAALNVGKLKNQLGAFHPATDVFLCRELLFPAPEAGVRGALSEVLKVAILQGGRLLTDLRRLGAAAGEENAFWNFLPLSIEAKMQIVRKDPTEKTDIRRLLNLGHTLAHALELALKVPHGEAVGWGLEFSLWVSLKRGLLSARAFDDLYQIWLANFGDHVARPRGRLSEKRLSALWAGDKKTQRAGQVRMVLVKNAGQCGLYSLDLRACLSSARELGWISR